MVPQKRISTGIPKKDFNKIEEELNKVGMYFCFMIQYLDTFCPGTFYR